jgi:hypothetical protein
MDQLNSIYKILEAKNREGYYLFLIHETIKDRNSLSGERHFKLNRYDNTICDLEANMLGLILAFYPDTSFDRLFTHAKESRISINSRIFRPLLEGLVQKGFLENKDDILFINENHIDKTLAKTIMQNLHQNSGENSNSSQESFFARIGA